MKVLWKNCQVQENKSLKTEDAHVKEKTRIETTDKNIIEIMGEEKFKSWKKKSGKPNRPQLTN